MSHLRRKPHTRLLLIVCALLLTAGASVMALRGVSAETLGKFGITEQSRVGKLIGKIAPQAFASKSTETAQGEAALKLLKDRGEYASLQKAMETARYRAHAEPQRAGEFAALNPAQELHSRFTPQGIEVRRRSDDQTPKVAMTLRGIGYGERQLPVSPGTVTAQDQRIEIQRSIGDEQASSFILHHSSLTEWYINRPTGLEQGFTIAEPPTEKRDGERLRLTLELSGEWRAKLSADGQAVEFREASGAGTVRYDHLAVRDAAGKTLPARMSLKQSELRLEVEDAGAVWPVTIDPTISQQAYLKASNTEANDAFGCSVAVSGDTVVVGAYGDASNATGVNGNQADNSAPVSGAAYVFTRSAGVWAQQAYLKASNTEAGDFFGWSVGVSGDTVVVGAILEDSNATGINGNQTDNNASGSGAAYVFTRSGVTWTQQAYLKASNTGADDNFGREVAVSGDTVVIATYLEDSNATGINGDQTDNSASSAGAAYVFTRSGVTWTQQAYLKASNTAANDDFGESVAVSGDTVIVGADFEDSNATGINGDQTNNSGINSGAVYVFTRSAGVWTQQAYLKASNTGLQDLFGVSVAVSGDTVVVGAVGEDSNATGINGDQGNNLASGSGAAYVFTRSAGVWTQQAYLKASNTEANDQFGHSVAVSGDTVVVGAEAEDSSATGINGNQTDNSATTSGAAYIFTRSAGVWAQQAYLKASNTDADDRFGKPVAVSGDTVVIGAILEDSNATGINGGQSDNSAADSGAAYVFTVINNLPTITPASTLIRQQGSDGIVATIATVGDSETPAGSLVVTATTVPAGISVTAITNSNGTVSANVAAGCTAPLGNSVVVLTVTDANGGTATANLTVNVIANVAPTLVYPASSIALGSSTTINPTTATDNGSINSYSIFSVTPPMTVAPTVNSSGVVSINNAGPFGSHTIIVRATDNCGTTADASFTLNVGCGSIAISPTTLVNGLTFVNYSQTLTATGGSGSYTFSLQSGTLPAGLSLAGNVITGTPTTAQASTFTIRATDDNGCFGERVYTLNIGSSGLMYYPLARPVRLLDTRPGASANACYQPDAPIAANNPRTQPARGTCEGLTIPANATTITGHITTVQSGGGSLTLYPSDAPQPTVSNSNYLPNEILNNAFTVGLGVNDGAFKLLVSSNTDIVIDLTGYYAPPSASGLYFHPLPKPIRLLDTRTGFSGCQTPGAPLQIGTTRTQIGVLTCDGVTIPTGALALVGNATTTNSTGNGYLTLWPADAVQPFASSSNFAAGVNRNAPFTVGLSLNGEFNIYTARTTDLVIDVMGYYSTEANDANGQGLLFNSLGAPLRLMDTRAGQPACYQPGAPMTGQTVYTQETQIPCTNLTSVARGLVGNVSALNATANGFVTFWPSNAVQPTVATSNYQTNRVFNRHFTVGLGPDVAFKRYVLSTTDLIIDISGFFAP